MNDRIRWWAFSITNWPFCLSELWRFCTSCSWWPPRCKGDSLPLLYCVTWLHFQNCITIFTQYKQMVTNVVLLLIYLTARILRCIYYILANHLWFILSFLSHKEQQKKRKWYISNDDWENWNCKMMINRILLTDNLTKFFNIGPLRTAKQSEGTPILQHV